MKTIAASLLLFICASSLAIAQKATIGIDIMPHDAWAKFSGEAFRYRLNQTCESMAWSTNMVSITIGDTSYIATLPDEIASTSDLKSNIQYFYCFVHLKNDRIYRVQVNRFTSGVSVTRSSDPPVDILGRGYLQLRGDDLYLISNSQIAVSRDEAESWQMDMTGLPSNADLYGCTFDSNQTIYLGTSAGLYRQALGGNTWEAVGAAGTLAIRDLYVDPLQRIWVYSGGMLGVSTDGGSTFAPGPSGLAGYYATFSGDVFGNVYAATGLSPDGYDSLYYSAHGTEPFVRIDGALRPMFRHMSGPPYTSLVGDSLLLVGTTAGPFMTSDFGQTWTPLHPFPASHPSAFVALTSGNLVSTETGVYRLTNGAWQKVYPTDGFADGTSLLDDPGHNTVYLKSDVLYRSKDGGATWTVDSIDYSKISGDLSIDNQGTLHALHSEYVAGIGNVARLWRRESGGTWTLDTTGLPGQLDSRYGVQIAGRTADGGVLLRITTQSNASTSIYASQATGGWSLVADYSALLFSASSGGGVTVATGMRGVLKLSGGQWQYMNTPSDVNPNSLSFTLATVSSSGRIWAWFEMFDVNDPGAPAIRRGLYYSDDQSTWTKIPFDSVQIAQIIPSGDTAFVLTTKQGMYHVSMAASGVSAQAPEAPGVQLVMLPGSRTAALTYSDAVPNVERLSIMDVSGREVYKLGGSVLGTRNLRLDLSSLASGVYVYQLSVVGRVATGKLFIP